MANATGLTMIPTAKNIQNILKAFAYYSYVNLIMDRMKINLSKTSTLRVSQHVINFKFHSMR